MADVAFLLADQFEDSEMDNPYKALEEAGHTITIIGLENGEALIGKHGSTYITDFAASEAKGTSFDAVIIPGGGAPETLRVNDDVIRLVTEVNEQKKLIAGICHGPQVMISADILKDRNATCFVGIRDDIKLAGATYQDQEVVVSENIITARTPKDEPAFIKEILKRLNK
ncbi:type 1 glutamine amidotransferase domain-containing protein [Aquibacillus rhizosphaerae]|uniref:Type 1 glutamine amidotransferase domain-containing protein n=1 Tax=Aquibacillus rhizosphaerae TaxID=3051431 RepID=A0ABT7LB47_9BACI|nr:type 1 glutamine amidotransferase domain-containing protein [Aquibacillus sp. LR5S19]MDL4843089.1 type 1 glutamine amidotransferase domain-containing protein [Aquibacillus sp. LR5S19]